MREGNKDFGATIVERMPAEPHLTRTDAETAIEPENLDDALTDIRLRASARLVDEAKIGEGGMGTVAIASDLALGRKIAKKALHSALRYQPQPLRMFLREARVMAVLDHPNIVPIHDIGEDAQGHLYFTMKLVRGKPLKDVLKELPPPPLEYGALFNLLDVVVRVCDALAFAHNKGIVHCDVKASNVMVGDFGEVYLVDWGIARFVGGATDDKRESISPSTQHMVIGSASYMSPEQAQGNRIAMDARSDVYLLGGILYEIVARRPPHVGGSFQETLALAIKGEVPRLRDIVGSVAVPPELDRIVMKALAKQKADRYPSALELKDDLVRFMRGATEFPRQDFPKGSYIVKEGDPGDAAYIIASGACDVLKVIDGTVSVMHRLGPGQVFGEMAILTEGPRTATVMAVEDTCVQLVTRTAFDQELAQMKPWMRSVIQMLASRFRDLYTQKRVTHVGQPNPTRIARQLLFHLSVYGTPQPDGSLAMAWTKACAAVETQLSTQVAMGALGVVTRYPRITIDFATDTLAITDPRGLAAELAE